MNARANFQKSYLMRYAILTGVCLFLALWFAYDGLIGYPAKIPAARAYDELRELDAEERSKRWQSLAAEHGWSQDVPEKKADEIEDDIHGQYFWSLLNLLVGVPALVYYLRSRGSWVEAVEGGLTTSWGQTLKFVDVTHLNKKRWAEKGIAKATYTVDGTNRLFVFDDFKFEREPLDAILASLEEVLPRDKIVGGPTEAETASKKAAEAEAEAEAEAAEQSSDNQASS